MNLSIFFLLLIAHVLGDFYLQPAKMVEGKQSRIGALLLHAAIYMGVTLLCTAGYLAVSLALYLLGLSVFHLIVDWVFRQKDFTRLLIDQSLHIAAIALVSLLCTGISGNVLHRWILDLGGFPAMAWSWVMTPRRLAIVFFVLFNLKPANILIVKLLRQCGLNNTPAAKNSGAVIGNLERILTFILILCGEYLAGTLVVALKSIGRIKKLDDKEFSDKFIIGSLFSLMIPVLSVIIINVI